jgi:ABC-2 type transport system permease protein
MNKIKTIVRKEWAEVFKKRMVLFSVIFLPLFLSVLPLVIMSSMGGSSVNTANVDLPAQFQQVCKASMTSGECMQYYLGSTFMIMFMMIPLFIPVNIASYSSVFAIGSLIITGGGAVAGALLDPMWLMAVFIAGPLMAVLSVNFSIMVSSRVNDPRVAEQVSAVVILPLLAVFLGQVAGLFVLNSALILIMCVVLFLVDLLMVYLSVRLFQRETILTRWK